MHDDEVAPMLLTDADRCDSCGSRAFARAVIRLESEPLLFCAHHWRVSGDAVRAFVGTHPGAGFLDETAHAPRVLCAR